MFSLPLVARFGWDQFQVWFPLRNPTFALGTGSGVHDSVIYNVPLGRDLLLTPPIVDLLTAPVGAQKIAITVGYAANPNALVQNVPVTNATPIGEIGGRYVSTYGTECIAGVAGLARIPGGTSIILRQDIDNPADRLTFFGAAALPGAPVGVQPAPGYSEGLVFQVTAANMRILGTRFYKTAGDVGPHIGRYWTMAGAFQTGATFLGETASGWQEQLFPAPIPQAPGVDFMASVHFNVGNMWNDAGRYNVPLVVGPLVARGPNNNMYKAGDAFPSIATPGNQNAGVDVIMSSQQPFGADDGLVKVELYGRLV